MLECVYVWEYISFWIDNCKQTKRNILILACTSSTKCPPKEPVCDPGTGLCRGNMEYRTKILYKKIEVIQKCFIFLYDFKRNHSIISKICLH